MLFERLWTFVTQTLSITTFSSFREDGASQIPVLWDSPAVVDQPRGPVFRPGSGDRKGSEFLCDYSSMVGWRACSTHDDRGCWLTNDNGGIFDINTNYENEAPQGILRQYTLNVTDGKINADGLMFSDAKLFNEEYPGPWLQACWGDTVEVTVHNNLAHNGTSIHWHGIRQNQTMHMDGVNGITQCPIAPGDSFVYRWETTQYGSTWYHSHYSLQYADGMVGPMTIHGPSSAPFDEAPELPLLMTDWGHNSAFNAIYNKLEDPSILLNGRGNVTRFSGVPAKLPIPTIETITFEKREGARPRRYLLRLINTSFDTTFVFSIDNHRLTVIGADFVPIHGYTNTSVLIGIGQRYHVIVEANPINNGSQPIPSDGNFWMRTYVASCRTTTGFPKGYELSGILRYDSSSTALPTSLPWNGMSLACSDETYSSLVPILKWKVGRPANGHTGEEYDVVFNNTALPYPLALFSLEMPDSPAFNPLRIDYNDPTFLKLNNTGSWPTQWVIVPEDYESEDWVFMVLAGDRRNGRNTRGAHPMHLHGHDFALLQQEENELYDLSTLNLKLRQPSSSRVVLLPRNGFAVIAFKTDNPGSWLMHCHIARHASEGLAMQVLERRKDANDIWPFNSSLAIQNARTTCDNWNKWHSDCNNYWPGGQAGCDRNATGPFAFQDDSGI
ncbi:hypothetical protein G7Y89_g9985 [Cudoniella acicularis]|uniref:Laccase n=1 Tax=Cudoniella acicularis TaxID=354080 RepID=A0A8H4RGD3_9HELO|nr:hypothetical protein G7Y89_g9985 [Cudoniella acicularis]